MKNCIRGPKEGLTPHRFWRLLFFALFCVLYSSFAASRDMNAQNDDQQPQPAPQSTGAQSIGQRPGSASLSINAQACYVGGTGPVPTLGRGISPMQGLTGSSSQMQGSTSDRSQQPGDYSQQPGDYSQQSGDYSQQSGDYSQQQGDYSQQQGDYSQQSGDYSQQQGNYSQQSGDYSQQQGNYSQQSGNYSQQPNQYSTGLPDAGQGSDQSAMPSGEIVAILQQEPDVVDSLRNALAQGFGVDSTTITDDGVYNCIRVDPQFRGEATAELQFQGFIPSGSTRQLGTSRRIPTTRPRPPEQPSDIRTAKPIPYRNLPSLIDLYSQDVAVTRNLRRFGSNTFEFGTGNANQLPMDLPAGPDYVLGPGDNLMVNLWGSQSNRFNRTVDRQGQIALPEAGPVTVARQPLATPRALFRMRSARNSRTSTLRFH